MRPREAQGTEHSPNGNRTPGPAQLFDAIPDPLGPVARGSAPRPIVPSLPSPTRADRSRQRQVALGLGVAWVAGILAVAGLRKDLCAPWVVANLLGFGAACGVGAALLLRPRRRGLPAGIAVVWHLLWAVPAIYLLLVALTAPPQLDLLPTLRSVAGCLRIGLLMAAGPLVAAWIVVRRSLVSAAAWRGGAAGALAGLAGALGLHAHCAVPVFGHLLWGHAPILLVGAVVGALVGRYRGIA